MPYRLHPRHSRCGFGALSPSSSVQQALLSASQTYGVPLPLLTSVARHESGFNPSVTSSAGAQGLMQIMPGNDAFLGVTDPYDPVQSANAGAKFLSQLYQRYGDWGTALIAYNEGPTALATKGVYPGAQSYADAILAESGQSSISSVLAGDQGSGTPPVDPSSGMPVDTSASDPVVSGGLSQGAWVGIGIAGAALLLWAAAG